MPTARADTAVTLANTAVTIAVLANDSGSRLKVAAVTRPANGTATINPDQTVTYRPVRLFTGTDTFTCTIRDAAGKTARAGVTVTVRNRPPVAAPDSAVTDAGRAVTVAVLANDSDPDGHALAVAGTGQPAHGTAVVAGGGVVYTPVPGYTGGDSFTYRVTDGRGGEAAGSVAVFVRNTPPVAGDDAAATDSGEPVTIAVLANDNDPDGHALTLAAVGTPAHGEAVANPDGTVTYRPVAGFAGADGFTYAVTDGRGGEAAGSVAVTVRDRPPLARPDAAAMDANGELRIAVLANDDDPEGRPLQLVSVGAAGAGSTAALADGSVAYRPAWGFVGEDRFVYRVADAAGAEAEAEVTVQVRGLGEPFADGRFFTDGTGWIPAAARAGSGHPAGAVVGEARAVGERLVGRRGRDRRDRRQQDGRHATGQHLAPAAARSGTAGLSPPALATFACIVTHVSDL